MYNIEMLTNMQYTYVSTCTVTVAGLVANCFVLRYLGAKPAVCIVLEIEIF